MRDAAPFLIARLDAGPERTVRLLATLANARRLKIVCVLRAGERSVGDLAERTNASQSTVSQHLSRLRQDGLVTTRRAGQSIYYRLADARIERLVEALAGVMLDASEDGSWT
jgi:ArsR family transcriptional regulator, virulence genes transcriptional regulator